MHPQTLEEAKALDRIVNLIASHKSLHIISRKSICDLQGVGKDNFGTYMNIVEQSVIGLATITYGNMDIYTDNAGAFKRFLENGGFEANHIIASTERKQERRDKAQQSVLSQLQTEQIQNAERGSKNAKLLAWLAILISIAALGVEVWKTFVLHNP